MRVVFDTNVYVSALVVPGGSAELAVERVLDQKDQLVVSPAILSELARVLAEKFRRDPEKIAQSISVMTGIATVIAPIMKFDVLAAEPDNRVLECAVASGADAIVTGDKAMLALKTFRGVRIITLREYLESA